MTADNQHIFFVDDEPAVCRSVSQTLQRSGYTVSCFADADHCLQQLQTQSFLAAVQAALKQQDLKNLLKGKSLSKKEMAILRLILQSRSNKEIAQTLHRSIRTVEDHRRYIMRKLDVDNVVDLV